MCPSTGEAEGMVVPYLNTDVMNLFLNQLKAHLSPNEHAVVILDRAGYHRSKRLEKSDSVTLVYPPPL